MKKKAPVITHKSRGLLQKGKSYESGKGTLPRLIQRIYIANKKVVLPVE